MQKNYIFGKNTVKDALISVKVHRVFISDTFTDNKFIDDVKKQKIDIVRVNTFELSKMVKGNHQGVVAEVDRYEYSSLQDIINVSKKKKNPVILILDGINDPGNFGAILRSADAFDVAGVIIKKHGQVMVNSTVAKTSTGAINHVKVAQVSNLSQTLEILKKEGFWSVGTDGLANTRYQDLKYDFPCALIIGSEGEGISPLLLKRCDYKVKIDMYGHVNSLNASVATGIMLAHIKISQ